MLEPRIVCGLAAALFVLSVPAFAGEGKSDNVFRKNMGGMEVVALLDARGMSEGAAALLIGAGEADLRRAAAPGALAMSVNAFVVGMNGKTILFDTGLPIKASGGIQPALKAAGIAPEDIDAVVITHFHFDHVGGLMNEGKPVFPKAELYVPRVEVDKWSGPGTGFLLAYNVRTNAFEYDREILPGVKALAATGHTPGHTVFLLENGGEKLLIIGDLIHISGVQLANPEVAVTYDVDPVKAVASRKRVFAWAAAEKLPVASMHMPFPGMGVLSADGTGYSFETIK